MELKHAALILDSLHEGVIVVDRDLVIRAYNPAAERLTGRKAEERLGRRAEIISVEESPVFRVLQTGQPEYNVRQQLKDGRVFELNFVPLRDGGEVVGVIQTFRDVTHQIRLERRLTTALAELDEAFALTLPNTRIERKLKQTPEFRDVYDPETGLIEITEVIPDGTYRHVINALKVAADLHRQGATELPGIDKDLIVQTIIFHDVGKVQPRLQVGDVVDPRTAFEESTRHAARSAEIAARWYGAHPDVVELVRYHHHREADLPASFPAHLLPMLRLFQVIDGLSACITRRDGVVRVEVEGTRILVDEYNPHPAFSRRWFVDLYTGERGTLPRPDESLPTDHVIGDVERYLAARARVQARRARAGEAAAASEPVDGG